MPEATLAHKIPLHSLIIDSINAQRVAICLFLAWTYWFFRSKHQHELFVPRFQRVGKSWWVQVVPAMLKLPFSVVDSIQGGYEQINKKMGEPFAMRWWAVEFVILPPKYLQDLKRADFEHLNFFRIISEQFSLHASVGDLYHSNIMIDVVKKYMNPQLGALLPMIKDECDYAFEAELGAAQDWQTLNAQTLMSRIMHRTTSRVLVGPEICRNQDYITSSMTFTMSIFINGVTMALLPMGPLRKQLSWLGSWRHRRDMNKLVKMIQPVVEMRMAERAFHNGFSEHNDAIQWTIEVSEQYSARHNNAREITLQVLHNLWAGSTAPSGLCTQMLFQLLMEPKYISLLRDEAQQVIGRYGWSEKAAQKMVLLDSFVRETNRLYSAQSITCNRLVMHEPFTFHDGLTLPVGTRIGFPALGIQKDSDYVTDPHTFDGLRYARLSERGADTGAREHDEDDGLRWGAATPAITNLVFGYGKHACPGRFYALRKVKFIFAQLLLEYDIAWAGEVTSRPESFTIEGQFGPNPDQLIRIRKRLRS